MSKKAASRTSVHDVVRRPGPGWRFVGCSTWQHDSGVRVHLLGIALMPDRTVWREHDTPIAKRYIGMAGGNRKRGLMMWALALHQMHERSGIRCLCDLWQSKTLGGFFRKSLGSGQCGLIRVRRTIGLTQPPWLGFH